MSLLYRLNFFHVFFSVTLDICITVNKKVDVAVS